MPIQCPNCGSRFLRESKPRDAAEKLLRWRFVSPLRCLDCKVRFVASTINIGDMRYAHCPTCDRMDLNQWTGKNYIPPFWVGLWASLGANRWRCEYCRINFSSFRKRKEIFTFKRWKNLNSGDAVAQGRARMAELEAKGEELRAVAEAAELVAVRAEAEELATAEAELKAAEDAEAIKKAMAATVKAKLPKVNPERHVEHTPQEQAENENAQGSRHDLQV
jgi:DNA-directed RNA polymerase subunit RPC12/RpoP